VSATNQNYHPKAYLDAFPTEHVGEIHLGGHEEDEDEHGKPLLIDAHNNPVVDPVWALYDYALSLTGPVATLIEWDNDVPEWSVLRDEALRADKQFFDAVAGHYVRINPPTSPLMMFYGSGFPEFLDGFEPAKQLPYLPDMARLELARRTAYHAADDPVLDPDALSKIAPEALGGPKPC